MGRKIDVIQAQILDQIAGSSILGPLLTSPSKVAFWREITFVVAVAINLLEQVIDVYKSNLEIEIFNAPPGSPQWLQNKVLQFQYTTSTDPTIIATQGVVSIINFVAQYAVVNPALRIVTNCAVTTSANKECLIKVATGASPSLSPLSTPQVSALAAYIHDIGFAGLKYTIVNYPADTIIVGANIYYDGQYSNVIAQNVKNAINVFISTLPFDGVLKVDALEDAIQAVTGVTNVVITFVSCTAYGSSSSSIVTSSPDQTYKSLAGYLTPDTSSGNTLDDTLFFSAQ